jgi:hypothetical protein
MKLSMNKWFEAVAAIALVAGWFVVAETADGVLRADDGVVAAPAAASAPALAVAAEQVLVAARDFAAHSR